MEKASKEGEEIAGKTIFSLPVKVVGFILSQFGMASVGRIKNEKARRKGLILKLRSFSIAVRSVLIHLVEEVKF